MCTHVQWRREGPDTPELELYLIECWESSLEPLQEQDRLLAADVLLQPLLTTEMYLFT